MTERERKRERERERSDTHTHTHTHTCININTYTWRALVPEWATEVFPSSIKIHYILLGSKELVKPVRKDYKDWHFFLGTK